ncbi:MAG TPA: hypothetical protein VK631_11255 [Solirubrobacteraceae bacterium]|nr:hypothetical protein [Solirubrobacteraceae bacterium]
MRALVSSSAGSSSLRSQQLVGPYAKPGSPKWAKAGGWAHGDLQQLARDRDGDDLGLVVVRPVGVRLERVRPGTVRAWKCARSACMTRELAR